MIELDATLFTAAICGLLYLVLSYRVSQGRMGAKVSLGDGGNAALQARIRAHANFSEYVPLILVLMAVIELARGAGALLWLLGLALIVSRILHAVGLGRPAPNPYRMAGTAGTWLLLLITSLWALFIAL